MKNPTILFALLVSMTHASAFANSCPDLQGVFRCPALPERNQPELTFMITQKNDGARTIYKSLWSTFQTFIDHASDAGEETSDGYIVSCKESKRYFKRKGSVTIGTVSFLNPAGNYESWIEGKKVAECPRLK